MTGRKNYEIIGNTRVALGEYKLDRDLVAFGEYGVCRGRLLSLPWKHITHGLASGSRRTAGPGRFTGWSFGFSV